MEGTELLREDNFTGETEVDLGTVEAGTYFVQIKWWSVPTNRFTISADESIPDFWQTPYRFRVVQE